MVDAARTEPAVDVVLEVGAGQGILTRALKKFKNVIAIEKDPRLAEELRAALAKIEITNCEIITGDILKIDIAALIGEKSYAVIANIPYYLTSRLIRIFLESGRQPRYMILMVQKEVAERIVARPPCMNLLALSVQAYGHPKIIGRISKKEFNPEPKVDSAIVKISDISKQFFTKQKISEADFFAVLRTAFSQKRKKIANSLAGFYGEKIVAEEKIKTAGLRSNARAQELSLEDWTNLLRLP